jgi:hypothetical protein
MFNKQVPNRASVGSNPDKGNPVEALGLSVRFGYSDFAHHWRFLTSCPPDSALPESGSLEGAYRASGKTTAGQQLTAKSESLQPRRTPNSVRF